MSNSESSPESGVEAIKESLFQRVRGRIESDQMLLFQDRPEDRAEALRRLTPETFNVTVTQMPPITKGGVPLIAMGIRETEKEKSDGIHLQIRSDDEQVAFWRDVTPTDFAVLCEDSALEQIEVYEKLLRETPDQELDSDYNGAHTYRSLYEMQLGWANQTLEWVKQQSPLELKERIKYF